MGALNRCESATDHDKSCSLSPPLIDILEAILFIIFVVQKICTVPVFGEQFLKDLGIKGCHFAAIFPKSIIVSIVSCAWKAWRFFWADSSDTAWFFSDKE